MVIMGRRSGEDSNTSPENLTNSMATERSRSSLHNFSLPRLKWGEHRQLRCAKVVDDGANAGDRFPAPNHRYLPTTSNRKRRSIFEPENFERPPEFRRRASISDNDGGIGAVSNKIMFDLQKQVDRMKSAVFREGSEEVEPPEIRTAEEATPWNLRTRRSACKDPSANGGSGGRILRFDERKPNFSLPMAPVKLAASQNEFDGGGEKRPRAKLRVPLMKKEIEDDFVAMTGIRPPWKPKKRPKHIQKQIDRFLPGLRLSEIRASMYKVNENADGAKK